MEESIKDSENHPDKKGQRAIQDSIVVDSGQNPIVECIERYRQFDGYAREDDQKSGFRTGQFVAILNGSH
jgi:hypothetical protein